MAAGSGRMELGWRNLVWLGMMNQDWSLDWNGEENNKDPKTGGFGENPNAADPRWW